MKFKGLFNLLGCCFFFLSVQLFGRSAFDSVFQEDFAPVDRQGNVIYSTHIANLHLGEGQPELSLSFDFCSGPEKPSPHLGWGWKSRLFDARAIPMREDLYQVQLICAEGSFCGKTIYLLKDPKDPRKYSSVDKEWKGELDGDKFRILREGFTLEYEKGKLHRMLTRQGQLLEWIWKDGVLQTIRMGDQTLLEARYQAGGPFPKTLIINGKNYDLGFDLWKRKEETRQYLSSVVWPDGSREEYKMEFGEKEGKIKITTRDKKQKGFSWDSHTGKITSDDQYTFVVGKSDGFYEKPPISKTNKEGKTSSFYHDTRKGVASYQSEDGVVTREFYGRTKGNNYQKLYRVEKEMNGKKEVVFLGEYDSHGYLVKTVEDGITRMFAFDEYGNRYEKSREGTYEGEKAEKLKNRENELLANLEKASSEQDKDEACATLGCFCIHEKQDIAQCMDWVLKIKDKKCRFNVLFQAVFYDRSLTPSSKKTKCEDLLKEYPEEKKFLEEQIEEYAEMLRKK